MQTCSVEGCDRPVRAKGWCKPHYERVWRFGHLKADLPIQPTFQQGHDRIEPMPCPLYSLDHTVQRALPTATDASIPGRTYARRCGTHSEAYLADLREQRDFPAPWVEWMLTPQPDLAHSDEPLAMAAD